MSLEARRAAFANLIAHYHNSFAGVKNGVYEHSPRFIQNLLESGKPGENAATLRLDPRLTATDDGAVAFSMAKAISEDKGLAKHFLDIELTDKAMVIYFEHQADAVKIERVLSEVGKIGWMAKPGDRISDSLVSDLFIVAAEAKSTLKESVVAELKKRFAPEPVVEAGANLMATAPAPTGAEPTPTVDDKDAKPEAAAADPKPKPADVATNKQADGDDRQTKDELESVVASPCKALGLDERIFGDAALAALKVEAATVNSLFTGLLGEKARLLALNGVAEADQTAALLRVLGARGLLEGGIKHILPEAVVKALDAVFAAIPAADAAPEGYNAIDEAAVAIDAVAESAEAVFKLYVDRLVGTTVLPERRAKVVGHMKVAAEKNERAVLANTLCAIARCALFERGVAGNAEESAFLAAWKSHVTEATKPAAEPADPLLELADSVIAVQP